MIAQGAADVIVKSPVAGALKNVRWAFKDHRMDSCVLREVWQPRYGVSWQFDIGWSAHLSEASAPCALHEVRFTVYVLRAPGDGATALQAGHHGGLDRTDIDARFDPIPDDEEIGHIGVIGPEIGW